MNNAIDFSQVIENEYGIKDIKSYEEYKKKSFADGINLNIIDKLSPDNIDNSSFWKYIEEHSELAKDAIAYGYTKEKTIDEVNNHNFVVACQSNVFGCFFAYKDDIDMPILDIGAGYGMLKNFCEKNTKWKYYGVDVYPKFEGCYKVGSDGYTLPIEIVGRNYGIIICTNVFQHLSVNQRRHYYEQVEGILHPEIGLFIVNMMIDIPTSKHGFKCNDNNKKYVCHYGQYTEVQSINEVMNDLSKNFKVISISHRLDDNLFTFTCCPKPKL